MFNNIITLSHLNNISLQKCDNNIIIWITHDKDYHFGWYYLIKDNKLYLVYDTEITYEEHFIKEFNNAK